MCISFYLVSPTVVLFLLMNVLRKGGSSEAYCLTGKCVFLTADPSMEIESQLTFTLHNVERTLFSYEDHCCVSS